jgi:uncharacterized protein DUF6526
MSKRKPQSYANHRKFVPGYHFVASTILVVNFVWALYRLFRGYPGLAMPLFDRILAVAVATALLLLFAYVRTFPLKAQDRVIRLEEMLRLEKVLPPDLKPRIRDLRPSQLIALRFACEHELPELTRKVLNGQLRNSNEIKKAIQVWREDHFRL